MVDMSFIALPEPRAGVIRSAAAGDNYLVVGVAIAAPASGECFDIHKATRLFCIRADGAGVWLSLDHVTFVTWEGAI